ncbi:MAG: recombination protein RecO [Campylobacteraceae bacterium]|nr:recombination protein RecO [Campylobacteraceae bacterium]
MQGYITNINRAKNEDLIITILTAKKQYVTYRFYGARHSTINLGYKIDFELQRSYKSQIPQLRSVLHLAKKWNIEHKKMYIWQQFIKFFYVHLKGIEDIDKFYFELLEECYKKWSEQNPKRVAIESYIKLLQFEGRLHNDFICFECEKKIEKDVSLLRAFLPAHKECVYTHSFKLENLKELFENKSTLFFDDEETDLLWQILCEGF